MAVTTTLAELDADYDVLLFDAYGVLVDLSGPRPGAARWLEDFERRGRPWLIVTNDASRRPERTAERYRGFGLPVRPEHVVSSGSLLPGWFEREELAGARTCVLGPEDSASLARDGGAEVVPHGEDFEVLVIADEAGYPLLSGLDDTLGALLRRIDRGDPVRLVLPNPDLIYPKSERDFGFASGSLALMFEAALRRRYGARPELAFEALGKPESPIFEEARRRTGGGRTVMVGDQLETDIAGARRFGWDAVLVAGGVASGHDSAEDAVDPELGPTALLTSLE